MRAILHIDGGARGNPGPAGVGVLLTDADTRQVVHEAGYFLGTATNNVAEYRGLIRGIDAAAELGIRTLDIRSDSELMVKQIHGQYRVKAAVLKPLHEQARQRLRQFDKWDLRHVPRSQNARADRMANLAMDAKADVTPANARTQSIGTAPGGTAASEKSPTLPCWTATVRGRQGRCLAGAGVGNQYTFGPTTPEGLCVHAAAASLHSGPLQWSADQRAGKTRCAACGQTIELERIA